MAKSIFFSWQLDTPPDVGRRFLREALEEACQAVTGENRVSEAKRDETAQDELVVDSDTEGVAGQPPVVETILKKIDEAAVVIADVTFTGQRLDGRPTPNANVLIEYGWALKSLGHTRSLTVMNEAYGTATRDSLPFDLSHLRLPTRFTLPADATPTQKAEVKRKLVGDLKVAIRTSLATIEPPPILPSPLFPKAVAKDGPARFRPRSEEIGFYEGFGGRPPVHVFLQEGAAIWLRLMPSTPPNKEWTAQELQQIAQSTGISFLPITHGQGLDWLRAEDGWGIYSAPGNVGLETTQMTISGVAFAFQTGELWSIESGWLDGNTESIPFFETRLNERLQQYAHYLAALGVPPPYHWAAGITGVKGRKLAYPPPPGKRWMPSFGGKLCLSETIEAEGTYEKGQKPSEALRPLYEKLFAKCGIARPDYL